MRKIFARQPLFGVEFGVEQKMQSLEHLTAKRTEDDIKIVDVDNPFSSSAYYMEAGKYDDGDKPVHFNEDLGLACEKLPDGLTLEMMWHVY